MGVSPVGGGTQPRRGGATSQPEGKRSAPSRCHGFVARGRLGGAAPRVASPWYEGATNRLRSLDSGGGPPDAAGYRGSTGGRPVPLEKRGARQCSRAPL